MDPILQIAWVDDEEEDDDDDDDGGHDNGVGKSKSNGGQPRTFRMSETVKLVQGEDPSARLLAYCR